MEKLENIGKVNISTKVLRVIAEIAAREVEGFVKLVPSIGKENKHGIEIAFESNVFNFELNVMIEYGYNLETVSNKIQKNVKNAIETMTGLEVSRVNVNINDVAYLGKK